MAQNKETIIKYVSKVIEEVNNDPSILFGLFYEYIKEFLQKTLNNIFFNFLLYIFIIINKIVYLLFFLFSFLLLKIFC